MTENISEGAWEQLREGEDPELEMARVQDTAAGEEREVLHLLTSCFIS